MADSSIKIPVATIDPATAADGVQMYAKDVSGTKKLFMKDSAGTVSQIGAGGSSAFSGVSVFHTLTQSVPNSAWTPLNFNSETFKTAAGYHSTSTNTSRLVAQATGYYFVKGEVEFAGNGSGSRAAAVGKNSNGTLGAAVLYAAGPTAPVGVGPTVSLSGIVFLNVNEYLELFAWQDSGAGLNVSLGAGLPPFIMEYRGS